MATINTSDSMCPRFLLLLIDYDNENQNFTLQLNQDLNTTDELNIIDSGIVHNSHYYSIFLCANKKLTLGGGALDINDETNEEVYFELTDENPLKNFPVREAEEANRISSVNNEGEPSWYKIKFDNDVYKKKLFSLIFGLVKVRLNIEIEGKLISLETPDIACACDAKDYEEDIISGMLDELIDAKDEECINWMLSPVELNQNNISMVESAPLKSSAKNLQSLVDLADETIEIYKKHLNYFSSHGHCKTTTRKALVRPESVKKLGKNELLWLAQNPDRLYESKQQTALNCNGKFYMASRVQTECLYKSFDNVENRALVSFANEIFRVLGRAIAKVESYLNQRKENCEQLKKNENIDGSILPTLKVIKVYQARENKIIDDAKNTQKEIKRIHERLLKAFPDVLEVRYVLPRRTKVFQEILPYARIHEKMRKWNELGRNMILRDTLALGTLRIDKLYEYYVLYKMLRHLKGLGFSPDPNEKSAFKRFEYDLKKNSSIFFNEKQVANTYSLKRDEERVTLYYQPVFYGDKREENSITFHRTTASREPYWTPDYLIVHKSNNGEFNIVVDAKFRPEKNVTWRNAQDKKDSAFLDCILKYKTATCGSSGEQVDALWILYGRTKEEKCHVYQYSCWAKSNFKDMRDGIAPLSPKVDRLANMMEQIGIR